jgi:hypothetical protein
MTAPRDFYCEQCRAWTPPDPIFTEDVRCSGCGDLYGCGECGFEIDANGDCLRPEGHHPVGSQP